MNSVIVYPSCLIMENRAAGQAAGLRVRSEFLHHAALGDTLAAVPIFMIHLSTLQCERADIH